MERRKGQARDAGGFEGDYEGGGKSQVSIDRSLFGFDSLAPILANFGAQVIASDLLPFKKPCTLVECECERNMPTIVTCRRVERPKYYIGRLVST